MRAIDWNKAASSLEKALVPGSFPIDGRTDRDHLSFLADFATLINFYDFDNTVNGNWAPFLLKDPVILLAHISTTDVKRPHKLFLQLCNRIEQELTAETLPHDFHVLIERLMDELTKIFMLIERWTKQFQYSAENYPLKKYVITQVRENFSTYFWSMIELRQYLSNTGDLGWVSPVYKYLFDSWDKLVWKESMSSEPFWSVLNIPKEDKEPTTTGEYRLSDTNRKNLGQACFAALQLIGDALFIFFTTVVRQSEAEYEKMRKGKSHYPDTVLLRAFVDLLNVHRNQLNQVSEKHLDFYYRDILRQKEKLAEPDSAFILASLAKNYSLYQLPAGTAFSAGTDANKNPIVFANTEAVSLNNASIVSASTLSWWEIVTAATGSGSSSGSDTASSPSTAQLFNLQNIASPGTIQTDANGNVTAWPTFGSISPAPATLGFAFASPMLYLLEGTRTITLTFVFAAAVSSQLFSEAQFYLTTGKGWLNVNFQPPPAPVQPATNSSGTTTTTEPVATTSSSWQFAVTLDPSQPAIVPCASLPEGIIAEWPLLKVILGTYNFQDEPPVLTSLTIANTVSGISGFQLYNDNGTLSTKTPFQPYGPIADVNSNFVIGNNEIFSKPLTDFTLDLSWNNIPSTGFPIYYSTYNLYLSNGKTQDTNTTGGTTGGTSSGTTSGTAATSDPGSTTSTNTSATAAKGKLSKFFSSIGSGLKNIWNSIVSFFKSPKGEKLVSEIESAIEADTDPDLYSNSSFEVTFSLYDGTGWSSLNMAPDKTTTPAETLLLFQPNGTSAAPSSASNYYYSAAAQSAAPVPDPSIQNSVLAFSDNSTYGFLKMTLEDPANGFGNSIYASVVTWAALTNAQALASTKTTESTTSPTTFTTASNASGIIPSPNPPFAPKMSGLTASYDASITYQVNSGSNTYPLQFFYYSPFGNYSAWDTAGTTTNYSSFNTICGQVKTPESGIFLFPAFPVQGALFLEIANLNPPQPLSLFFQFSPSAELTVPESGPAFYYLSSAGWNSLQTLQDGTNGFNCPGIIVFDIPGDCATHTGVMPGTNSWIALAVNENPTLYAQTVLLAPNGIEVQRTGTNYLTDTQAPQIAAGTISKPVTAIPQVASFSQPFASFGGKAAESKMQMNRRVSRRIKTKGRAITGGDIFTLLREEFTDLFFSKTVYSPETNITEVFVVKKCTDPSSANAYSPMISQCEESEMQAFLGNASPLFVQAQVSNFTMLYVTVTAVIEIIPGYAWQMVQDEVMNALNLFFSPWILSTATQMEIDKGFSDQQVNRVISQVEGIASVQSTSYSFYTSSQNIISTQTLTPQNGIYTPPAGQLFVSSLQHAITNYTTND